MGFHKTENVPYPVIYDAKREREYYEMYDLLPVLNELESKLELAIKEIDEILDDECQMTGQINLSRLYELLDKLGDKNE